jgi:hypothetical protein
MRTENWSEANSRTRTTEIEETRNSKARGIKFCKDCLFVLATVHADGRNSTMNRTARERLSSSARHHSNLGEVERNLQLGDSALCGDGLVGDLEVCLLLFGRVVDFAA